MSLRTLFKPVEQLIALDIGSGNLKMLEVDLKRRQARLQKLSLINFQKNIFSNNMISEQELVSDAIGSLLRDNSIIEQRANVAVPGSAALIKKIRLAKAKFSKLKENVLVEAGAFLPGDIDEVDIDFHIFESSVEDSYDVLVVAVKKDVVNSYLDSLIGADLNAAVIDVDYYALNNCFEMNYPELVDNLVALIDIGARSTKIALRKDEDIVYAGDLSTGGKSITDEMISRFDIDFDTAEEYKQHPDSIEDSELRSQVEEFLRERTEAMVTDFNRQLNLYTSSSEGNGELTHVFLSGGGALMNGFPDLFHAQTGLECSLMNPFRNIEVILDLDEHSLSELAPLFAIATGLAIRQAGDRIIPN